MPREGLALSVPADYLSVMNVNDPKIASLRATVKAAQQEFDMAVMFHEMWKPAAYDEALLRPKSSMPPDSSKPGTHRPGVVRR
jgi:hypothetical protein